MYKGRAKKFVFISKNDKMETKQKHLHDTMLLVQSYLDKEFLFSGRTIV